MNYNDFNRSQEPWEHPIETTGYPVGESPSGPEQKKKKHFRGKFVALCLVCALLGGVAGGAGVGIAMKSGSGAATIYKAAAGPTTVSAVDVSSVKDGSPMTASQIYATFVGSTVGINVETVTNNVFGQPVKAAAAGSGFVITADGYIVTNYHVIDNASSIKVVFSNNQTYDATLVGGDEESDIAVLKIDATGLTPVVIGDSDTLQVGETVVAIGNPLGELTFSLSEGVISAKDRQITMSDSTVMNMLQTDTAINNGNSGGPLFNSYGQVIGITSAKYSGQSSSSGATIEGIGFAIPINDVSSIIQDIMKNGYVTGKPYMGITVATVPESVASEYNMSQGALVKSVDSDSCASKAGLQQGDIITGIGDTKVTSSGDLITAKKSYKAGDTVTLTVDRNGQTLNLTITFDEDTPARRAAQDTQEQTQDENQQDNSSSNSNGNFSFGNGGSFWPFGWFY
jgi:serine protease Do